MDNDLNATFEACNTFNKKLKDTIKVCENFACASFVEGDNDNLSSR